MSGTNIYVYKAIPAAHAMLSCEILGFEHNSSIVVLINATMYKSWWSKTTVWLFPWWTDANHVYF